MEYPCHVSLVSGLMVCVLKHKTTRSGNLLPTYSETIVKVVLFGTRTFQILISAYALTAQPNPHTSSFATQSEDGQWYLVAVVVCDRCGVLHVEGENSQAGPSARNCRDAGFHARWHAGLVFERFC